MSNEEDSPPAAAKSAEDRKAASALANLDASPDDSTSHPSADIDQEAISKAMKGLPTTTTTTSSSSSSAANSSAAAAAAAASKQGKPAAPKKNIKLDQEDVALVVDQLELSKARAIELLKQHDGNAVAVLRMFAAGYRE